MEHRTDGQASGTDVHKQLVLLEPQAAYRDLFLEMVDDFWQAGEQQYAKDRQLIHQNFGAYLEKIWRLARGENLPPGRVAQREYWLFDPGANQIYGAIRWRLAFTARLKRIDGQIGYNIRPSARCRGYATRMLALLLEKIRASGWQRVLITCNADNAASARVIKKNGGQLDNHVIETETGRLIARYWIALDQA